MPWHEDGALVLTGCNTGAIGKRGWCPASVFAGRQKVRTLGQTGYAYFSKKPDARQHLHLEKLDDPTIVSRLLRWLARLSLLPLLALWGAIVLRVAMDPSNHLGWSPLWGPPWLAFVAGLDLLVWSRTRDPAAGLAALLAVASMIGLCVVDHFAVLISYESWIARGMPSRPF